MTEEQLQSLIYLHAISGGISLVSGIIPIVSKKGSKIHKLTGKIFVFSLLIATSIALFVSTREGHENTFLFLIGVLSLYFVISGWRSIRYKNASFNRVFDIALSSILFLSSIAMILYPIILVGKIHILFTIFGSLGLIFSVRDLLLFRDRIKMREKWMKLHVGNIMSAYISSVTAFVVVNNVLPSVLGWILPGILGGIYITVWMRKVDRGTWAK